jgi:hypothetical protein
VPVGVTPWAPETVTSMREVPFFFFTVLGVAVAVTVDACWLNGTLRPTSSGLWSEARNWSGWYSSSAL